MLAEKLRMAQRDESTAVAEYATQPSGAKNHLIRNPKAVDSISHRTVHYVDIESGLS